MPPQDNNKISHAVSLMQGNINKAIRDHRHDGNEAQEVDPNDLFGNPIKLKKNLEMGDEQNIIFNTGTGTKIGTATGQKLAFFNATPVNQAGDTEDIKDILVALGFLVDSGATPLNLDGGNFITTGTTSLGNTTVDSLAIDDGGNFNVGTTNGTKIASTTSQKIGFWGVTPVNQPDALTAQDTSITHTSPSTPDFAIQDLTQTTPFGFVTQDEGNTVLQVILNLQVRLAEVEARLEETGLVASN